MNLRQRLVTGVLLALAAWAPANAESIDEIIFFGDSLSDTGNVWYASGGFPPPPYNQGSGGLGPDLTGGQWSDPLGPSWSSVFASNFGLFATPSFVGGNNYAWGGARTGSNPDFGDPGQVPWLDQQVLDYFVNGAPATEGTLASIMIGGNDVADSGLLAAFFAGDLSAIIAGVTNVIDNLTDLYTAGIRNFLVASVPDVGATPAFQELGAATAALATAATEAWNGLLVEALGDLALPDADVAFLDLLALGRDPDLLASFANTTDACLTFDETTGVPSVCDDPASYVYWDPFHPSSTTHAFIADAAVASVPEPGTLFLLAVGLFGMGLFRRHRV